MSKRIFVSDIHISAGRSLDNAGATYDWLNDFRAEQFAAFLDFVDEDSSIDELALVGDILDQWVYPIDIKPPTYTEIAYARKQHGEIITKLGRIATRKKVTYIHGNHDMTFNKASLAGSGMNPFSNINFVDPYRTEDGLYAEHGHRYSMYNADNISKQEMPLGYYISRLKASVDIKGGNGGRWEIEVGDMLTELSVLLRDGKKTAINGPLDYFAEKLGIGDDATILKLDGKTVTLGYVKQAYSSLFSEWKQNKDLILPSSYGILAEVDPEALRHAAREIVERQKVTVVIFGHTHVPALEYLHKEPFGAGGSGREICIGLYGNCGSWCEEKEDCTYIEDRYEESSHEIVVKTWPDNDVKYGPSLTSASINAPKGEQGNLSQ